MDKFLDSLLELSPLTIYVLIAVFCWTEAALFLGFVTPGELAVVTGGILASKQIVQLDILLLVVTGATLAGNATGFFIGVRFGPRILELALVRRFLSLPIQKAQDFMQSRGEWAIVFGRVSTPTRVITPFLAGMSGMTYRRFVVFDVFASLLWAACFLTLGYLLGESWSLIRDLSGAAAILVLGLFITALFIRWLALLIIRHRLRFRAALRLSLRATGTRGLARMLSPLFYWLSRRLDPRVAQGLSLSICFVMLIGAIAAVGTLLSQTQSVWGLARFDYPVLEWMSATRTDQAVDIARDLLWFFQWPGILFLALPVMVLVIRLASGMAALRIVVGIVGAAGGASLLDHFVLEGHVANAEFPANSAATSAAIAVHAVALTLRIKSWSNAVACAGFAVFGIVAIAVAAVTAGWAAPSGIALGIGIGVGWASLLELPWAVRQTDASGLSQDSDAGTLESEQSERRPAPGKIHDTSSG